MLRIKLLDRELYASDIRDFADRMQGFRPRFEGDAGLDLRVPNNVRVHSGEVVEIGLGVAVEIPQEHVGLIIGRSTTATHHSLFVHQGVIDSGYIGEIHTHVTSTGRPVDLMRGDRVCQLIVVKIEQPIWGISDVLKSSARGDSGLGSTGR